MLTYSFFRRIATVEPMIDMVDRVGEALSYAMTLSFDDKFVPACLIILRDSHCRRCRVITCGPRAANMDDDRKPIQHAKMN